MARTAQPAVTVPLAPEAAARRIRAFLETLAGAGAAAPAPARRAAE